MTKNDKEKQVISKKNEIGNKKEKYRRKIKKKEKKKKEIKKKGKRLKEIGKNNF